MLEIVEDSAAQSALDEAQELWGGCAIAWEAVTWAISRDPKCAGEALNEAGTLFALEYPGAMSNKQPTIYVLYEVERHRVIIRDAKFSTPMATFAGRA
ncbi:hypothetical protein [Roseibium sp. MB-4]